MENRAYQDSEGAPEEGLSFIQRMKTGLSTAIGAVAALGIIFAMGVWFYRLGDRDARSVPIIRADSGPTKKIPKDPGGEKTPHQGIKSYEAGNGSGAMAGAAVITAAPPEPKPDDAAMGALEPPEKPANDGGKAGAPKANNKPDTGERIAAAPDAATIAPERPERTKEKPGAGEPAADLPAERPATDDTADRKPAVADEVLIIPGATAFAPDQSPYAPRRPRNLAERHKVAARVAVEEERDLVAEAARSPVQIQLVADPNRDAVIRLWKKVYKENVDILQGRALALQSTVSGGVTWYRLRVGPFRSRAEAASVCQALKARKQDCIVSRNS